MNKAAAGDYCGSVRLGAALGAAALLLALGFSAQAARIHPEAGSTSAAFLKIGAGARAVSLAEAYTATADDPYALFWNPAGLAWAGDRALSFTHNEHFQDLRQELLVYTVQGDRLRYLPSSLRKANWALGLNYFHTPKDLERRSGSFENDPLNPISSPEGYFRAYDLALSLGAGLAYDANTNLGGAIKLIGQAIDDETGLTAALDLGLTKSFNWLNGRMFTAGLSVLNIGPGVKLVSRTYPLPLTLRAGLSHRLPETGALVTAEISKPIDNYYFFSLGLEQRLTTKLFLRTGYRYRQHGNELGGWSGFAAGLGLALENLSFDYAFKPFGEIGNSHLFSMGLRFGQKGPPAARSVRVPVLASEKLSVSRLHAYSVTAKPLKISPSGVQYQLDCVGESGALRNLRLRVSLRGVPPAVINVAEGELPEKLRALLPRSARVCHAFQLLSVPGNVQGDLMLMFRLSLECSNGKGSPSVYYLSAGRWGSVAAETVVQAGDGSYYRVAVPQSTHYVIVGQ